MSKLKKFAIPISLLVVLLVLASLFIILTKGRQKQEVAKVEAPLKEKVAVAPKAVPRPERPRAKKKMVLYDFEGDIQGWEIPDWVVEKPDHVATSIGLSKDYKSEGSTSLKVVADFPGRVWTAALVEVLEYFDWTPYERISCDVYIPEDAPEGLRAKLILTVADNWKFTEMSRSIFLMPGKWTTIRANLMPDSDDWKRTVVDDAFREDVRKVVVRIESNKGPRYSGAIYIDNIKVSSGE